MSSPAHFDRLNEVFDRAADLALADRAAYLDAACAGDEAMRIEVEALLAAEAEAGQFLADPSYDAAEVAARVIGSETTGSVIGPYTLVKPLGDGGFGTVFLADQSRPVRRKVALKIIKLGMDTRQVIARFEAERQALAMMEHPGIAKVHDAGATATGRPYFVMEYVDGVPITKFCDGQRLGVKQRLELFLTVCQAVQHAHQKGIIHRDLKPGNVLVTLVDGRPTAKVIDFGIAKATTPSARLTEATMQTAVGQLIGTPTYMSPEQAAIDGSEDIDTRSDVYSLGVMLYELLVGAPPFDPKSLRNATYADLQRAIREIDPPRPSTRLSAMRETAQSVVHERGLTDPRQLRTALRGELDWIVMRCLQKRRADRYDSASALAADITRYLKNEPVEAGPPTRAYRLRKFVRRHRGPVAAAAVVLVVLVGGILTTALAAVRATRAERIAVEEKNRTLEQKLLAERRFNDVRKLAGSFIFEIDDAIQKQGPTKARERLVKTALEYLDALAKESSEPELLRELQESYKRVGIVQYFSSMPSIGDPAGARDSYRKSLELAQRLAAMQPGDKKLLNEVAGCWYYLAEAQAECGDEPGALNSLGEALAIYRGLAERFPEEWLTHRNVGMIMHRQGTSAMDRGLYEEARDQFARTLELREGLLARWPDESMLQRDVRVTASSLAMTLVLTHEPAAAQKHLRRSLAMLRDLVASSPEDAGLRREMNSIIHRLAEATRDSGQVAESLELAAELVAANRKRVADDPADREAPLSLSGSLYTVGRGRLIVGPLEEALRAFEESRVLRAGGMKVNPNRTTERWLADSTWRVAETLRRMGRFEEAERVALDAVAMNERRLMETPEIRTVAPALVICRSELARAIAARGRFDEALAVIADPLAVSPGAATRPASQPATRPSLEPTYERLILETRGEIYLRAGRFAEARSELERAVAMAAPAAATQPAPAEQLTPATQPTPAERPAAAEARILLVRALAGAGRSEEAVATLSSLLAEVEAFRAARPDEIDAVELLMLARRAQHDALLAAGQAAAAADAGREAVELARRLLTDPNRASAAEVVAALAQRQ